MANCVIVSPTIIIPFKNGTYGLRLSEGDYKILKDKVISIARENKLDVEKLFHSTNIISCENGNYVFKTILNSVNFPSIRAEMSIQIYLECSNIPAFGQVITPKYLLHSVINMNSFIDKNTYDDDSKNIESDSSKNTKTSNSWTVYGILGLSLCVCVWYMYERMEV